MPTFHSNPGIIERSIWILQNVFTFLLNYLHSKLQRFELNFAFHKRSDFVSLSTSDCATSFFLNQKEKNEKNKMCRVEKETQHDNIMA